MIGQGSGSTLAVARRFTYSSRLYMQPTLDDSSHDETLSSCVAALNMLDLGLEHLDIHVGDAGPELDLVVKACGESSLFPPYSQGRE